MADDKDEPKTSWNALPPFRIATLRRLRRSGYSIRDIGIIAGCSPTTVQRYVGGESGENDCGVSRPADSMGHDAQEE